MSDIFLLHRELVTRVLDSDATAPKQLRWAAFDNAGLDEPIATLISKVANRADEVTDDDVAVVLTTGLSEDQVFEIVVCAAIGKADRQHAAGLAALAAATGSPK